MTINTKLKTAPDNWYVEHTSKGRWRIVRGHELLADVFGYQPEKYARLMAAAPELLQSLELVLDLYEISTRKPSVTAVAEARAAIAKAKGEA